MPFCATFHRLLEKQNNRAIIDVNGRRQLLEQVFGDLGNISSEDVSLAELLKGKLVADLRPQIDQCYALGPYTLFDAENQYVPGAFGTAIYRAKYWKDGQYTQVVQAELVSFIKRHPLLRTVDKVAVPPSSSGKGRRIGALLRRSVVEALDIGEVVPRKIANTGEQKNLDDMEEDEAIEYMRNTMVVDSSLHGKTVVVVDDVLGSSATLREVGRALREAGASNVYGVCVTKKARHTNGGLELRVERWQ